MQFGVMSRWIAAVMGAMLMSLPLGLVCAFRQTCINKNADILPVEIFRLTTIVTLYLPIVPGLILGWLERWALTSGMKPPSRWVLATTAAVIIGPYLGLVLAALLPGSLLPHTEWYGNRFGYIVLGCATTIGVAQWYLLRDILDWRIWILVHIGCGFIGSIFFVENYYHRYADPIVEMMKAGLIVGVYAVSSGWILAHSLKNKSASAQQIVT